MKHRPDAPGRRVHLHRAVAKLGWGSRTQAWDWIRAGQVRIDGRVVTEPLTWVDLDRQQITRDGVAAAPQETVVLALHKPRGIVTTRSDERGRPTVYDLLPPDLSSAADRAGSVSDGATRNRRSRFRLGAKRPWLFPVGRLDADSEGLLLFTNDASLAVRLTEPGHEVPKTYHVTLRTPPTPADLEQLRRGIDLHDGRTRPAAVRLLHDCVVEMVLTEGRNRQIRRMWAALGNKVRRLVRVAVGAYPLGDLAPGKTRRLETADQALLLASGGRQCPG